ncbi:phage tail tip fiber protein [Cupriavidus basilensis]|uniref:phage tail tip fiber protein n=1 Tax=Cupriavidus basilensis TaxID=68895 RepID=UPI00075165D5|nr:DUF1983 domain-containing protein [Cupriavidus basilensis]
MASPPVPSIPESALGSINDKNVYLVLRAIADILNVRNGQTGDSDSAFVTRGELGSVAKAGTGGLSAGGARQSQGGTFPVIKPSDIARVITDLQAQVMESPLFKALGERIDRVDAPGTGVIAQLDEERTVRSNAVSSLVQLLTTLESTVGDQSVALQEEAQTRADADGNIMGKYSVKIDANGYVSGFGLISTANNGMPFSDFTIRADRFAIGSPTGPGVPVLIPFIVTTTTQVVNGYIVPPGVYIDAAAIAVASIGEAQIDFASIRQAHIQNAAIGTAQIQDAAITNAKIGNAEVDTLSIRGDAVTVPRGAHGGSGLTGATFVVAASAVMPAGPAAAIIFGVVNVWATSDSGCSIRICRDSTVLAEVGATLAVSAGITTPSLAVPICCFDSSASAGGTYSIQVGNAVLINWYSADIALLGAKR